MRYRRGDVRDPAALEQAFAGADVVVHLAFHLTGRAGRETSRAISGNIDGGAVRALVPARLELELGGARIGMVHIPGPAAGRRERLRSAFPRCDAVVFGHTHMPEHDEHDGFQIFNPGSPTERRRARAHTMGLATIEGGRVEFELLALG